MVNILHLIGGGEIGGAERHVLSLLTHLHKDLYNPFLVCLTKGPFVPLAKAHGIPAETFAMKHPLDLSVLPPLLRWCRAKRIQLIHTHGSRANLIGRSGAKWLGIPCVSTVHSSLAHDYLSPKAARLALFLDRLTLGLTSGIITVSDALKREVAARGGKNIRTIYNGMEYVPLSNPAFLREKYRELWHIPPDRIVIGNIARLHPTKGHEVLIKALALVKKELPNVHLVIVGDGPLRKTLEKKLSTLSIPCTLAGFIPNAYETLPAMDLFVLSSLSEGMGLVLLEAMQAGIPIVASHVGGIPEVVRPGQEGILVPPGDESALAKAFLKLVNDRALAERLTEAGKERRKAFTIEAMVKQTEAFYAQLLSNQGWPDK